MRRLSALLTQIPIEETIRNIDMEVEKLCFNSNEVQPNDVFVAVRGTHVDGHLFIGQAIEKGAKVIVCETLPAALTNQVTYVKVLNSAEALGKLASNWYGNPASQLKLIGVTGTNGKTTIATLLFNLFRDLGFTCGLLSTVENRIENELIPATHTTPDPIALNSLLAKMVENGCDYCFMEVSSHAIVQRRIAGLQFSGGIFSNITHDHLDFHQTFANYLKAKKMFFDTLPSSAFALVNADDKNGSVMLQNTLARKKTYSLTVMADFRAKVLENTFAGLLLSVEQQEVWFKMIGAFNAYNLLAVYAAAMLLEQDSTKVLASLSTLSGAEGRFECIAGPHQVMGIVDYAHTPDALQNVLQTIHAVRNGIEQVITVIGCGGDRDKTKRPLMAQVACDWSDKVIFTTDNPRSEEVEQILKDMDAGVMPQNKRKVLVIADRKEAIKTACHLAKAGDIILVAGKGHEKYQEIKGVKSPFDDKGVLTNALIACR